MRILSVHLTPLDRQILESSNIIDSMRTDEECLNNKNEWGGSKIPSMKVFTPKGVGGTPRDNKQEDPEQIEARIKLQEAVRRGIKRLQYREKQPQQQQDSNINNNNSPDMGS